MAYVVIEDFKAGLDTRKLKAASPTGSLQSCKNAHITRGGEIEKRKQFVGKYDLPSGQTFGFVGAAGLKYVFGSLSGVTVPPGVIYQRLVHPSGFAMTGIVLAIFFDGKVFAAARFSNDDVLCYYDGTVVTDWEAGSGAVVAGQKATSLITLGDKVYATFSSVLAFCAVETPTAWQTGSGYGFINMSNQSAGSETLVGTGEYQNYLAILSRRNIQIWFLDPDPLQNAKKQVLRGIGTFAAKSIVAYGDSDLFFLSDSGVRSLRARDASNQANVNDVGTAIDDELIAYMKTLTDAQKMAASGTVDPIDGRYILALGDRNYCFSYFPASRISAWSTYELGFTVSDWVSMDGQVWARSGDTIYLYGGDDGNTYDASDVEVEIPYVDGRQIASWKEFTGLDFVCEGEWRVYASTDPTRPDEESLLGTVSGTTLADTDWGMVGQSPVLKLRLVNARPGPAKMSKIIIHYETTGEDA